MPGGSRRRLPGQSRAIRWPCWRLSSRCARLAIAAGLIFPAAAPAAAEPDTHRLSGHGGPVKSVVLATDGKSALTGSFDYSMIHWDLSGQSPRIIRRYADHDAAVNAVAFVPGTTLALSAGGDGAVALWDLGSGKLVKRFTGHEAKVIRLAVSADGAWALSASWDRTARLWNLKTRKAGPVLKGHTSPVNDVAFTADGKSVLTAGYDGTVRLWRLADGAFLRVIHDHGWGVNVIQPLPGGATVLAGGQDGRVVLIDIAGARKATLLAKSERPVLAAAQQRKFGLAATGGGDGAIRVWDTGSWRLKHEHKFPFGPVWALAMTGDGKAVYFAGLDDYVAYWQMQPDKPFEVARPDLPRRFQTKTAGHPGALQFARKCSVCHTLTPGDANRAGPSLYGIFGRRAGTISGYPYSTTLKQAKFTWTEQTIDQLFAQGPENFVPGTKMPLQKMDKAADRKALIEFLKTATRPN